MKKIVALVLSLVMVLGLATVAFGAAADATTDAAAVVGGTNCNNWTATLVPEDDGSEKDSEFATYSIELVAKNDNAVDYWATGAVKFDKGDDETFELGTEDEFVKVAVAAEADVTFVDGKTITYLALAKDYEDGWDEKAVKVTLPVYVAGKEECDTVYAASAATATYYEFNDTLYVADTNGSIVFNVDGAAVTVSKAVKTTNDALTNNTLSFANGDFLYVGHDFKLDSEGNTYGEKTLTKVYCGVCGENFAFVAAPESEAITVFGVDGYADSGKIWDTQKVWVATAVAADAPATDAEGDKVESAETFDAGIAMYVGMSVMAAAGSAVVLKKKD